MVKAKVIEKFDLKDFDLLANIKRADKTKDKKGSLYLNDTFECDEKMANYLTGNNPLNKKVIEIIEVKKVKEETKIISEDEEAEKNFEEKPKTKKTKKSKK